MCRTGKFNMSYESLTSYEARQKLRDLKETDPKFWDQLTQKAAPDVDIPANKHIAEDEDATDPLFEDDSDLPCDAVVANVLGSQPAGVRLTTSGDMTSTAAAELLKPYRTDMVSDDVEVEGKDVAASVVELGTLGRGKRKRTANRLYDSKSFWRHNDRDTSDQE
jgi:hypothetical protein